MSTDCLSSSLSGYLKLPFGSFLFLWWWGKSFFGRDHFFSLKSPFSRKGVRKILPLTLAKQPLKKGEAFLDRGVIDEFWLEARKLLWKASCYHLERLQGRIPLLQHTVTLDDCTQSGKVWSQLLKERIFHSKKELYKSPWLLGCHSAQGASTQICNQEQLDGIYPWRLDTNTCWTVIAAIITSKTSLSSF